MMSRFLIATAVAAIFLLGTLLGRGPGRWSSPRSDKILRTQDPGRINLGQNLNPPSKLSADNDSKTLNIHVVPHTHDDVGWLKTVEQYFYGENMTIQHACVEDILDSVVAALLENPSRTFTYVEQKFFSMWWKIQDEDVKDSVRFLVENKQLSFVNGGWCMHDEAATHFMGMIDQTTLGHRFLKKELGVIPRVGWQLDPFGHSASQASYFTSKVGFDALYFGRIDYQDLSTRHYQQECEGLWNSSRSFDSTIFWGLTGSYEGNYGAPRGYCFDILCHDPYIVELDNPELEHSMHELLAQIRVQSDRTRGNHVMLTMGEDFNYQRAHVNYANVDLMISSIEELQRLKKVDVPVMFGPRFERLNIFYSSPDYYTQCKHEESTRSVVTPDIAAPVSYSVKSDDFMPYSDCEHCFWTGYFTSRAGLKRLERVSSSFLLSARQIETIPDFADKSDPFKCQNAFDELEDASGVAQHHDGVSGTSKQHVAYDYAKRIQSGIDQVSACTASKLRLLLLGANATKDLLDLTYCQLLNETKCSVSQTATAADYMETYVVVYNGLAQARSNIVHLPISRPGLYKIAKVGRHNDTLVGSSEAVPVLDSDISGSAPYRLPFLATQVPALGADVYKISKTESMTTYPQKSSVMIKRRSLSRNEDEIVASNEFFAATFNGSTGALIDMKVSNQSIQLEQVWGYYTSFDKSFDAPPDNHDNDSHSKNNQNSGAYVFRPSQADQFPQFLKQVSAIFFNTSVGLEVHATFEVPWIKTITRVMKGQPFLEVEYSIGPIPINDGRGKEVITQIRSPVKNSGTFYTDSNGREFMERRLNHRPTWDLNVYEPVAGNYYPVNAAMYIQDSSGLAVAVATDRSQGGTSLQDGALELMVHRRTLADDWRGVDEPMNETDIGISPSPPYGNATRQGVGVVIKGTQYIRIGHEGGSPLARSMMDQAFVKPLVFVGSAPSSRVPDFDGPTVAGLTEAIPPNVMLITRSLQYEEEQTTILLRLGHQYGVGEDSELSEPVKVNLTAFLPGYEVTKVVEMTLSANQEYQSWQTTRRNWSTPAEHLTVSQKAPGIYEIQLNPMDIRTFLITVK